MLEYDIALCYKMEDSLSQNDDMYLLSHSAEYNEKCFQMSYIFQLFHKSIVRGLITKYEKQRKYFPILPEVRCNNHFTVKCLLKLNMKRSFFTYFLAASSFFITM